MAQLSQLDLSQSTTREEVIQVFKDLNLSKDQKRKEFNEAISTGLNDGTISIDIQDGFMCKRTKKFSKSPMSTFADCYATLVHNFNADLDPQPGVYPIKSPWIMSVQASVALIGLFMFNITTDQEWMEITQELLAEITLEGTEHINYILSRDSATT